MPLRSFTPAELSLTERKRLEQPLLVMIWLGVVMFALAEGQLFYLLAGTLVVGVNILAVRSGKEVSLQRLFVNLAVLGATGVLFLEVFLRDLPALRALGHYLILIQLCKLFERKRNRDYAQMLALSLTTVVAAGLISRHLWFAVALAAYLVLAARVIMIFTLKRGLDAAAAARLPVEAAPLPPDRVAWNVIRHWPGSALRRRLLLVLVIIAATSVVTFLLVPRTSAGPGLPPEQSGTTGPFTDQDLRIGDEREIYLSSQVVMRVHVEGAAVEAPSLYLRGAVYDRYADSRWTQGPQTRWAAPLSTVGPPPTDDPRGAVVQKVSMHPSLLPVVYATYPAVSVETDAGQVRHNPLLSAQIMADDRGNGPVRYTATSWPRPLNPRQKKYLANLRAAAGERLATGSEDIKVPPRVRELAQSWFADLAEQEEDPSDATTAGYFARRLRREYEYTLSLPEIEPGQDALEEFLFRTRRGHCEYFATALAVMCNAVDVRARLAVGFLADERDALTGQYVVRERDAHAWVEVFTPETDWEVFDATPGGVGVQPPEGWGGRLQGFWSSLQFAWYDRVIGFDSEVQKALAKRLWHLAADAGDAISAAFNRLGHSIHSLLAFGYVDRVVVIFLGVLAGTAGIVLGILLTRIVLDRLAARRRRADPLLLAQGRLECIPELLAELEDRGLPRRTDWTLRRRALAAARRFNLSAVTLLGLTEVYYGLRWGGHVPDEEAVRDAELAVRAIRRQLSA
ncbi:MAG: transglutaminase TgpA family protein [Phycisphaerae bacterium]